MAIRPKSKVDKQHALELILKGKTYKEVGDLYGVTPGAIHQQLKPLMVNNVDVQEYKKNKADLINRQAALTLYAMTPDKAEEATYKQLSSSFKDLNQEAATEEGRASRIIEVRSFNIKADVSKLFG